MKKNLLRILPSLFLALGFLSPEATVGQESSPIWIPPQELYRFRLSNFGYSLSALYQESKRDGFYYDNVVGSIYRPPAGYTPDPASGLVPLHCWIVVENGWRAYTYHSTNYVPRPDNYTYNGILGYVFPPATSFHIFDSGVTASLTQMSMWYSQSYAVFNGRGAPGYGAHEFPPHSSFVYQGVIAAMPAPAAGNRPDFCSDPSTQYLCYSSFRSFDVRFDPPPPPLQQPSCDPNEEEWCPGSGGIWTSSFLL